MKRLILIPAITLAFASCQKSYDLNTNFTAPTTLDSPSGTLTLDPASNEPVVLSWSGGGAEDGTLVLYDVLFADVSGSFEEPSLQRSADIGKDQLSISHADLNLLARKLGAAPLGTATIKWTVRASKGGDMKMAETSKSFDVLRPDGLSEIPTQLYLYGTATENGGAGGQQFRLVSEGVFVIYTVFTAGDVYFRSATDDSAISYFIDTDGKFKDADGRTTITASDQEGATIAERFTLDFNNMLVKREPIGDIHIIWADSQADMGPASLGHRPDELRFTYDGGGVFSRTIDKINLTHQHSAWGGQFTSDERYYFCVVTNTDWCLWRNTKATPEAPPATDAEISEYEIQEYIYGGDQWSNAFKLRHELDGKENVAVKIYTNKEGKMYHSFE